MKVAGSIALVTGANRGLGLAFARALKELGAAKVYAAARNPEAVTLDGVVPLKLDVTSDEDAAAAASAATDVNLLVNNAGIARPGGFLTDVRSTRPANSSRSTSSARCAWRAPSRPCWRRTAAAQSSTSFPSQAG